MSTDTALPPLYAKWMEQLLGASIAAETEADCFECSMTGTGSSADRVAGLSYYRPETKCCTYHPLLPGFLVGRILRENGPHGELARAELERRIDSGVGVIPTTIEASPLFKMTYAKNPKGLFGKTAGLRCPHYLDKEGGACGIRSNRPGICATWFCKHSCGRRGIRFWNGMRDLLRSIEHELSLWCVAQIAPSTGIVDALLRYLEKRDYIPEADEIDGFLKPARRRELWGSWHGRERDFYLESARIVESLSWDDVLSHCGPRVGLLAGLVTEAHHALFMTPRIPDRLRVGEIRLLRYGSEKCFVLACEEVLEFPRRLMEALTFFDALPVAEARQAIYQEKKVRMSDALIQRLVDFELLIPVDDLSR
ncbi:MAG: hypothetical protein AB9866_08815 [Syntrophobacteraceae bacterium]